MEETQAQVRLRLITYNARLVDARKAKGWRQSDMAQLTGLSTSLVGHIETLRAVPSENAMDEISDALDLPREHLFPETLLDAIREGLFGHRVAELEEAHIIRLTEARRARLLPIGMTEDEALEAVNRSLLKKKLPEILAELAPREQRVLELRFVLNDGRSRTLQEVGKEFHVTGDRIRQIEAKALRKLRHPVRARQLQDFL